MYERPLACASMLGAVQHRIFLVWREHETIPVTYHRYYSQHYFSCSVGNYFLSKPTYAAALNLRPVMDDR